jgi:SAM-dependent methyltransferase
LHLAVLPTAIFFKFLLQHFASLPRQLLTVDLVRLIICTPRYVFLYLILRRKKFAADITDGVSKYTIEHNIRGMGELSAPRSHLLIRPLISIDHVAKNARNLKVLSVGPRVEGEIYNLIGYGFSSKNVLGLDLFSYSPYITVGNMHAMEFPDGHFDVVISGWVLGYSDTKQKCADEMLRVTKKGGVIALGNSFSRRTEDDIEHNAGFWVGSREIVTDLAYIEGLFGISPDQAYFRYDGSKTGVNGAPMITAFEVR